MLIALWLFIANVAVPQMQLYASALLEPVMAIVITLAGITMILGAVGMKISNHLGATVIGGIFRAIGYIFQTIIHAIGWIIRYTFGMMPRVHNEGRRFFSQIGLNETIATILAVVADLVWIALIV